MNEYIPFIIYGLVCVFWGIGNAEGIKKANVEILHWANMVIHATTCLFFTFEIHWLYGLAMFFEAKLLFDSSINITRKKGIGYVTPTPKAATDKLEQAVFGKNGILPKVVYLILSALCLVLYYFRESL